MSGEYGPDKGPGKWVCRECESDNLTFTGDGTWNIETQRMDFEEGDEKPYCQECDRQVSWAEFVPLDHEPADTRKAPKLSRDYYGDVYIVIDDDGEPVGDYHIRLKHAREYREDHGDGAERYRIAKVPFKPLPRDDGTPDEIVDDPRAER